jgi:hypothetical protein
VQYFQKRLFLWKSPPAYHIHKVPSRMCVYDCAIMHARKVDLPRRRSGGGFVSGTWSNHAPVGWWNLKSWRWWNQHQDIVAAGMDSISAALLFHGFTFTADRRDRKRKRKARDKARFCWQYFQALAVDLFLFNQRFSFSYRKDDCKVVIWISLMAASGCRCSREPVWCQGWQWLVFLAFVCPS